MKQLVRALAALILSCCLMLTESTASTTFSDVKADRWYTDAVTEMAAAGLLHGYQDGTFRPSRTISAAEFVAIVGRCSGSAEGTGQTGHWAAGWLQTGLTAGWYDWDEIPPTGENFDQPIPRQIAVKILMKALLPDARGDYGTESSKIADFSQLDGRYYDPVFAAYAAGVVIGNDTGEFHPRDGLSRAEACILIQRAMQKREGTLPELPDVPSPSGPPVQPVAGGVSENGWLQVKGTQLCNEQGSPVVLRGMSTHGMQWFGQYANAQSIRNTATYGANVFRIAMYTGEGGYLSQPDAIKKQVVSAVDNAIACDMYVIIDWHILSDGNPMSHVAEAEAFFTEMAKRYKDSPAVLYEICNEPNGNVSWSGDVKPYAQRVVAAIRAQSPNAVILIGSPTWSQDIHLAAADPVEGENLMYTLHFYAGTHGQDLRNRIDAAQKQGLPVFISEWGTSRADGGNGVYIEQSKVWLDFLSERGISWCNWSLCDKNESSAALVPGTPATRAWTDKDLSQSGQFVFSRFSS